MTKMRMCTCTWACLIHCLLLFFFFFSFFPFFLFSFDSLSKLLSSCSSSTFFPLLLSFVIFFFLHNFFFFYIWFLFPNKFGWLLLLFLSLFCFNRTLFFSKSIQVNLYKHIFSISPLFHSQPNKNEKN